MKRIFPFEIFSIPESSNRELQISGPTLDIGILKQQYAKLRQRQRQAHVIISAACNSNFAGSLTQSPSVSVNHLLIGKSALVNKGRRIGPPEGSIPPNNKKIPAKNIHQEESESKKFTNINNYDNGEEKESFRNNNNNKSKIDEEEKEKTNHDRMKNKGEKFF